jgi:chemotaxis protein CheD
MRNYINVHIGEVKVAKNGEIIKTILGSCVGIGFIWEEKKMCGLAHCLLPQMPNKSFQIGARFVDQAVPSLIALMKISPEDKKNIKVIVSGGSNMTNPTAQNVDQLIGSQNIRSAHAELEKNGFSLLVIDQGTNQGKKIIIDAQDCTYIIETIPNIHESSKR